MHRFGNLALHTLIWTLPLGLGVFVFLAWLARLFPKPISDDLWGIIHRLLAFQQPSVSQRFYFQVAVTTFALTYFGGCLLADRLRIPRSPVLGTAILFAATAVLSSLNARSMMHTLREAAYPCSAVLLLAMVVHLGPSRLESHRLLVSLVFAAAIAALLGVLQYRGLHLEVGEGAQIQNLNGGRFSVRSLLGHPNYLSVFAGSAFFLSLGLVAAVKTRRGRVSVIAAATVLGVCVIVAGSRSIWFATLVVGVALITTSARVWRRIRMTRQAWAGAALVALVFALFVVPNPIVPRRYSFTKRLISARPVEARLYLYFATARMIARNPIIGVGYNNYGMEFWDQAAELQKKPENRVFNYVLEDMGGIRPDQPHNEYLQVAAETGVLGLAAFFLLIVVFFHRLWLGYLGLKEPAERMVLSGMGAAVGVILIDCMFSFPLRLPWSTMSFWLILGLGSGYCWSKPTRARVSPQEKALRETGRAPEAKGVRSGRSSKKRSKSK